MQPAPVTPPVALTIAGSDCSAGAGLQADLKTFSALGVYGLTAVTCVVAEVPGRVTRIEAVPPSLLGEQLRLLLGAFPITALKTGMLYSAAHVAVVAEALHQAPIRPRVVIDPVMVATSGDSLMTADAVDALRRDLFPLASVVTPNLDELAVLAKRTIHSLDDARAAAEEVMRAAGCAVLAKGGHWRGESAIDVLVTPEEDPREFEAPLVAGVSTHGTGCTLSAAIAAGLAMGDELGEAVARAKAFVTEAIVHLCRWDGVDALNHGRFTNSHPRGNAGE